jgi:N-formylglutamate deformylase
MFFSEGTVSPYAYRRGAGALVVSMPHVGTFVPHSIGKAFADAAASRCDTDWHLPRLYDFLEALGATVITARFSRYVIDVNRPPGGENLYPGRDTPQLCPRDTFDRRALYARDEPTESEVRQRVATVWEPYHRRIERELERVRARHGAVLLWEAHSIVSEAPRLFEGRIADFNLGTADGASCAPGLGEALLEALSHHREHTAVLNARFKGGYITRRFGQPACGIHAVQMEMSQALYLDERCPYPFRADLAGRVRPILKELLTLALERLGFRLRP